MLALPALLLLTLAMRALRAALLRPRRLPPGQELYQRQLREGRGS